MDDPRFAVATFQRVFDTTPVRDVVDLERLVAGLTRFLVKPKTAAALERTERQIDAALDDLLADRRRAGAAWSRLDAARRQAAVDGDDPRSAALDAARQLRAEARAAPKRDLRLWSPTLYADGAERSGDDVVHLSCLVLDYDRGTAPEEASESWSDAFHVVHSTWSHTEAHPKFRLVLPLARPVRPADWRTVYEWAEERSGHVVDTTKKGVGTTFALPAVAAETSARRAWVRHGPLLDPVLEGLVDEPAEPPPHDLEPTEPNHFTRPIVGHRIVEGSSPGADRDMSSRDLDAAAADDDVESRDPATGESDDPWSFDLF